MRRRTLTLLVGATVLLGTGAPEALAGRYGNSNSFGGSAARARNSGEALAQSFYERAVHLGKSGQYGQAKALMQNVVRKNPSNEKYRYFYALLLYKVGDFGQAASECRQLERGSFERYRRKGRALMERIDKINTGEIPLVQPLRPSGYASRGVAMRNLRGLPPNAYMNVADMAGLAAMGEAPGVLLRTGAMSGADYSELRRQAPPAASTPAPGFGDDPMAEMGDQIATAASETLERAEDEGPFTADRGWIDPEDADGMTSGDSSTAEITDSNNPFLGEDAFSTDGPPLTPDRGWVDPPKPAAPKPAKPKPAPAAKPADNPFEVAGAGAFDTGEGDGAFGDAFEETEPETGGGEDVWADEEEPAAAPPAPPAPPPPAPEPKEDPPPAADDGGFDDGGFSDEGFGDGGFEETPAEAATEEDGGFAEEGFGDDEGFDSFEGF